MFPNGPPPLDAIRHRPRDAPPLNIRRSEGPSCIQTLLILNTTVACCFPYPGSHLHPGSQSRAGGMAHCSLFFVLCSCFGKSHHQADACHLASLYRGFCSIWNTHFCLRLQPHLYPVPVETSVGRSDGTRQRYKSTHV